MRHPIHTVAVHHGVSAMARPLQRLAVQRGAALGLTIAIVPFGGCGGTNSNSSGRTIFQGETLVPMLSGCPEQGVIGESFTVTISVSEGRIFGVESSFEIRARAGDITRIDDRTFTAIITPTFEGVGRVDFEVNPFELEPGCKFDVIPDLGACCESISCEVTDSNECFFRDGVYQGAGTICNPNPCRGACCHPGGCSDEFDETECTELGGDFQGGTTLCASSTCPETNDAETAGACCLGVATCVEVDDEGVCEGLAGDLGSTFLGVGSACSGMICELTVGACCIGDGVCVEITRDACAARTPALATNFQGVGRVCLRPGVLGLSCANPGGACCFGGNCQVMSETNCAAINLGPGIVGEYLGDNYLCRTPEVAAMCEP